MMSHASSQAPNDAEERLTEVARLLALGLLRGRLRAGKRIPPNGTREIPLELCAPTSPPVANPSRKGGPRS
jgi:hypothetical protein